MHPPRHDPVERLNEHHGDDLVAIARTFGGAPAARSARVVGVDSRGVDLEIDDGEGAASARVDFSVAADGTPRSVRGAFHRLATKARAMQDSAMRSIEHE
jgi:hypothetical protein